MYTEKSGLVAGCERAGELPRAPFVPRGVSASSISLYDMSAMLATLSPYCIASPTMMPLWDIHIAKLKSEIGRLAGVDSGNFKPGMVGLVTVPEGAMGPERVFLMNVNDAATLEQAFEAVKDLAPSFKSMMKVSDYEGYQIHRFELPLPAVEGGGVSAVNYTITRDQFIFSVGRIGLLQTVLSRIDSGDTGLWESDEVLDLFERIERPGAISRSYLNLTQYADLFFGILPPPRCFQSWEWH